MSSAPWPEPEVVVLRTTRGKMINYNYLVIDAVTRDAVIVDPSWQQDVIERSLDEANCFLRGILLTHSHPDHVDLAAALGPKYQCPIWMSKKEISISGFEAPHLIGIDEKSWRIGRMVIRPILSPGHTQGCMCYLIGDNLFAGDVLFAEGCGMCPDVGAAYDMFDSLQRLKRELQPHTRIFPGHSYGKVPGQLFSNILNDNLYLQIKDRSSFAAIRVRPGQLRTKVRQFQ